MVQLLAVAEDLERCLAGGCSPIGPGLMATSSTGRWPDHILTGLIISRCLPHWLSDKLADLYQWGELESPTCVQELSSHIFEVAQDPKRALDHIVKQTESWDPVPSGDDQAESDLVDKFLYLTSASQSW